MKYAEKLDNLPQSGYAARNPTTGGKMRTLFCGDRNWQDLAAIRNEFDKHSVTTLISGGARGADTLAEFEADLRGIPKEIYPADWEKYGKAAGPIRNKQMLDEGKPDLVIAFHSDINNSKGTKNMVKQAQKAGIPVKVVA